MYKYDSIQRGDWIKSKSCLDFKKRKKENKYLTDQMLMNY